MAAEKTLAEEFGIKVETQLDYAETVFLIEDQQDLRLIMIYHLAKLGFKKIRQFGNGHEAIHFMKENPQLRPGVTICDKDMPLMNGYDFLNEIRENPLLTRGAFAIALEQPNRSQIMLASENEVDGILVKPFTFKDIVPKLNQAFKIFHNPNNPELVYEMAKAEFRTKNLEKAEFIYKKLSEATSKAARPIVGLARVAVEKKQVDQALQLLDIAEKRNPFYVHTYIEKARLMVAMEKTDEGVALFKKAIDLSPLNPVRYEEAAELLFRMQKYQEAIDLLNIAFDKHLVFPRLHHYMSQAAFSLKDYKKAIRHIKAALSIEPDNVSYLNQLGVCYKESDMGDDATKVYNHIIKLEPDNRSALYNKAILLASKGQFDEAIKIVKRCIEKHPDFEHALRKLKEFEEKVAAQKTAG